MGNNMGSRFGQVYYGLMKLLVAAGRGEAGGAIM